MMFLRVTKLLIYGRFLKKVYKGSKSDQAVNTRKVEKGSNFAKFPLISLGFFLVFPEIFHRFPLIFSFNIP